MTNAAFSVTLADLRKAGACFDGYNKVVRMLQGRDFTEEDAKRSSYIAYAHNDAISLVDIAKNNGLDDALWSLRCVSGCERDMRLFAVWAARQLKYLMADERSINALDVAQRFANGDATEEELRAASDAAYYAASDAANDAAYYAAYYAASDVAYYAASDAAYYATYYAASDAGCVTQLSMFIAMCEGRAPWQAA